MVLDCKHTDEHSPRKPEEIKSKFFKKRFSSFGFFNTRRRWSSHSTQMAHECMLAGLPTYSLISMNGGRMDEWAVMMASRFFREIRLKLSHNGFLSFSILHCRTFKTARPAVTVTYSISQCSLFRILITLA